MKITNQFLDTFQNLISLRKDARSKIVAFLKEQFDASPNLWAFKRIGGGAGIMPQCQWERC